MNTGKRVKNLLPNWEELQKAWVERMIGLVDQVEGWAKEMDWRTRRIPKRLRDSRIGDHTVPGLLMQHEYTQAMLDPMGASAPSDEGPGVEGVVHLYILPAYENIARLFYTDHWLIDVGEKPDLFLGTNVGVRISDPLSRETFQRALTRLKSLDEAYQP